MLRPALLSLACAASVAHADAPPDPASGVVTYALVVGSNAAGPGQSELKYAEDDARRMGTLLVELGAHHADTVDVLVRPTPDVLRARIDKLTERVQADIAAGKQTRLLFYYSGHARSTALDLGAAQLPLTELRTRLLAVPATLTVVVLDACQSGAFSRVKGAAPAADFSWSSRNQLDARGFAVLASSTGSELSQESEQLRSSYFTHHLLVGMRGAGDANRDGQVSLDEAYRYAYHQTLLATAETAVGGQHVSLEVDLKGHGEVPLSFPRAATATIELPAALEGKALVEDRRAKTVVAETQKAKGKPVRIAVAPGEYEVLVRNGSRLSRCPITARPGGTEVDLSRCSSETIVASTAKGSVGSQARQRLSISAALGGEQRDAYTATLENFGYSEQFSPFSSGGGAIALTRRIVSPARWLELWAGFYGSIAVATPWERNDQLTHQTFRWWTGTFGLMTQGFVPLVHTTKTGRLGVYGQIGIGVSRATTKFVDTNDMSTTEHFFGFAQTVGAGIYGESGLVQGLGATAGYQHDLSIAIDNLTGDTHNSGGHRFSFGMSYAF